jgi:hypothetical protein
MHGMHKLALSLFVYRCLAVCVFLGLAKSLGTTEEVTLWCGFAFLCHVHIADTEHVFNSCA